MKTMKYTRINDLNHYKTQYIQAVTIYIKDN